MGAFIVRQVIVVLSVLGIVADYLTVAALTIRATVYLLHPLFQLRQNRGRLAISDLTVLNTFFSLTFRTTWGLVLFIIAFTVRWYQRKLILILLGLTCEFFILWVALILIRSWHLLYSLYVGLLCFLFLSDQIKPVVNLLIVNFFVVICFCVSVRLKHLRNGVLWTIDNFCMINRRFGRLLRIRIELHLHLIPYYHLFTGLRQILLIKVRQRVNLHLFTFTHIFNGCYRLELLFPLKRSTCLNS